MPPLLTRFKPALRKLPGYRIARFLRGLAGNTESRNAALLLLRPPKGLYQPYGTTSVDRYPELFRLVGDLLRANPSPRILSFGCATGEEVFTLRRCFPTAALLGIDINPFNIAVCRLRRLRSGDKNMLFATAASAAGQPAASYDAIFAMAVFRHGDLNIAPPPPSCGHRIRFADFDRSIADLARVLKPGGLLVVHHAMFRVCDTGAASHFAPVLCLKRDPAAPLYGSDDRLLTAVDDPAVILRKLG